MLVGSWSSRAFLTFRLLFADTYAVSGEGKDNGAHQAAATGVRLHCRICAEERLFTVIRRNWRGSWTQFPCHRPQTYLQPRAKGSVTPRLQSQPIHRSDCAERQVEAGSEWQRSSDSSHGPDCRWPPNRSG